MVNELKSVAIPIKWFEEQSSFTILSPPDRTYCDKDERKLTTRRFLLKMR